ncbi:ABC transporter substrate-binding protein [Phytoactinopolyspora halotolerans]|uniref:Extracellular solute-binding protein n=1 Tax=Phytoactinopolyspora halotolerans TaxID=1981512 RepID=A0A6L9S682_9ACTN|nr:substrate-binding domain-containing protein [Phytoactinopolyspora halotolerans]NED99559.1 extracellular solute-binding protein [Phytoactinopolyspora halotolerans]
MSELSRRGLFRGAGALGAATLLGACDTSPGGGGDDGVGGGSASGSGGDGALTWWDHNLNLIPVNEQFFEQFEKDSGIAVDYTNYPPPELGEALQLAKQSDQLPDVHSLAGLGLPVSALINGGWLQPVRFDDAALSRLPEGALMDGVHVFGGDIYTVPIFAQRQYWCTTWYNTEMLEAADVEPPSTYDEFRAAAKAVQDTAGGNTYGWIFNLAQTERVQELVNFLAQPAGFEGFDGLEFASGEIVYHHEAYLNVIEFLLSLQQDGLLFPGSQTLIDKEGRVRWAAGAAGFYLDGPWCAGSLQSDAPEFLDRLGSAPILVPDASSDRVTYRRVGSGVYFLSAASRHADVAPQLMGHQTSTEYYIGIAEGMAQPPLDLSAVEGADVHPAWAQQMDWFAEQSFLAPTPVVQNPEIDMVEAERKPIEPSFGAIVSGAFSGDVDDYAQALKDLSAKAMAERDRAIGEAKKKGAKVDASDYAFPDWKPKQDYVP